MIISTTDKFGDPWCPWCTLSVDEEGEFCSEECFDSAMVTIFELGVTLVEMNYIPRQRQPWYSPVVY